MPISCRGDEREEEGSAYVMSVIRYQNAAIAGFILSLEDLDNRPFVWRV